MTISQARRPSPSCGQAFPSSSYSSCSYCHHYYYALPHPSKPPAQHFSALLPACTILTNVVDDAHIATPAAIPQHRNRSTSIPLPVPTRRCQTKTRKAPSDKAIARLPISASPRCPPSPPYTRPSSVTSTFPNTLRRQIARVHRRRSRKTLSRHWRSSLRALRHRLRNGVRPTLDSRPEESQSTGGQEVRIVSLWNYLHRRL